MKMKLRLVGFLALIVSVASNMGEQCKIHKETAITCNCIGNEEFFLPEGYNYENVTSLRIASCAIANLHFSSLTEATQITEIIVQNISERLIFELFLTSTKMKRLKLSNIQRIPSITHDTFRNMNSIESVEIEDTHIDYFKERFTDIAINNFSLINVSVQRFNGLNFSEKGGTLRIVNSRFQNVTDSLKAYFSRVEILRSTLHLQKPGHLSIEGDLVLIENCVFSNASANVVAADSITINATCADGKSSMRLSSSKIESVNNRLPTEIVYTKNKLISSDHFFNQNNTVCIAGNCKCPKSGSQSTKQTSAIITLFILALHLLSTIFVSMLPTLF
ncbi:uncharacterized protein LOC143185734 [Calliopsis andreniformis]|uniref:uncharacterized protein LOC143185734 n=1 Tax=Calliopsis andreniformis TaxID=337506 RepID=UPI003FCCDE5D